MAPVKAQLYHSATSSITFTGARQEDISPEICSGLSWKNWVDSMRGFSREHRTDVGIQHAQVKAERHDDSDSDSDLETTSDISFIIT
jgi:hypothetical protein